MRIKDSIKWLWNASEGYRILILCRGMMGTLYVGISLFFIWICKCLIDIATKEPGDHMNVLIYLMAACLISRLLLSVAGVRLGNYIEIRFRNGLRHQLFNHLMESRWTGRERFHTGDILNRLEEDVITVTDMLSRGFPSIMVIVSQLIGALFFLSRLDSRLTGAILFIMSGALLLSKSYIKKMRGLSRDIRSMDSRIQSHIQEYLQHCILVRTLGNTLRAGNTLASLQLNLQHQVMRRTDFSLFSRMVVQTGFSAGYMTAFLWGVFGLQDGTVTFGVMAAFLQLVAQIQGPLVELSRQIPAFIHLITSSERLAEIAVLPLEQHGESIMLDGIPGIRVESLDFSYPDGEKKVLNGFTHNFLPGSLTAVIGETGTGKSTLLRLILALLSPDSGRIVFYNKRKEVDVSPLTRCNLSYVPQGNTLISGTIRDNLLKGNPNATDEELYVALHTAVADFVYTLPDGLNTLCGEQGIGLSEGQAQRIAIARGLLRPGRILLLDEPTSALDEKTEKILLERLSEQVRNKTLILITHREMIAQLCSSMVRMHGK